MATSVFDWNHPNCVKHQTNKSLKVTVRLAGKSSNQPWGKQLSLLSGSRTHTYPAILSLHSSQRYSGGGLSPKATDNEGSIHIWNKWQDRMTLPAPMHHVPNLWEAYHILTEAAFYYQGRRNCFSNPHTHTHHTLLRSPHWGCKCACQGSSVWLFAIQVPNTVKKSSLLPQSWKIPLFSGCSIVLYGWQTQQSLFRKRKMHH